MSKRKVTQNGQRDRPYNFMLVQQVKYLKPPYDTLDKLLKRVDEIGAERYAGILHDKDAGEEPHIHIFAHFLHVKTRMGILSIAER